MAIHPAAAIALSEREMGQIKVSIGTSLALEGAFGILEDKPNPKPIIDSVDVVYVNVRTLIRNLVGSMTVEQINDVYPEDLAQTLIVEMMVMSESIRSFTKDRVKTRFYICRYRSLMRRYPGALHKAAKTEKQIRMATREENTLVELEDLLSINHQGLDLVDVDIDLEKDNRRVLMLTSYAIDLLQKYKFKTLTLLESHTGNAKQPVLWHTKLTGGADLPMIPFDRGMVQFFGDNGNLFSPYPIKARRRLIEIAQQYKWSFTTTKDYVLSCVKKSHEPFLEELLKKLYRQ
jgi:hypothetical protein